MMRDEGEREPYVFCSALLYHPFLLLRSGKMEKGAFKIKPPNSNIIKESLISEFILFYSFFIIGDVCLRPYMYELAGAREV